MILYTTKVGPHIVAWSGTQADARLTTKGLEAVYSNTSWEEHTVPVDKAGLLAWLNEHAVQPAGANLGEYLVKRSAETPHLLTPQTLSSPSND